MCTRNLFLLFASAVKTISTEFIRKITLNTFGSMRPVIVIVNFLILNWTPLALIAAAAQQGQRHPGKKPCAGLEVKVGGAHWPSENSSQYLSKAQEPPRVQRNRDIKANTGAQGRVNGGWQRKGSLANCGQPCTPC